MTGDAISASPPNQTEGKAMHMKWTAPKFIEVSCGMEINRYAQPDGDEPVLF